MILTGARSNTNRPVKQFQENDDNYGGVTTIRNKNKGEDFSEVKDLYSHRAKKNKQKDNSDQSQEKSKIKKSKRNEESQKTKQKKQQKSYYEESTIHNKSQKHFSSEEDSKDISRDEDSSESQSEEKMQPNQGFPMHQIPPQYMMMNNDQWLQYMQQQQLGFIQPNAQGIQPNGMMAPNPFMMPNQMLMPGQMLPNQPPTPEMALLYQQ